MPKERQYGQDGDQEQEWMNHHSACDRNNEQHDGQYEKHIFTSSRFLQVLIHLTGVPGTRAGTARYVRVRTRGQRAAAGGAASEASGGRSAIGTWATMNSSHGRK